MQAAPTSPPAASPADPGEASSLAEVIADLDAAGYRGQWRAVDGGRIECLTCHTISATDVEVAMSRRVEGASDPDDMAIVIAVRCPACGTPGTLVAAYGPEASVEDAEIVAALTLERS